MAKTIQTLLVGILLSLLAMQPIQSQECSPPPFEKIYVGPRDIFTTSEGIFYINDFGIPEKIRALRQDCYGTYVIKFLYQCPICDRYYSGDSSPEGFDCPLWKREAEALPHQWSKE